MIPGSVSLAVCTVFFRRVFDTITGRATAPALSVLSQIPSPSSLLMASAALVCLYSQLKNGTLVRIGNGQCRYPKRSSSRSLIERRSKSKSWFLKNIWGRRKNCTKAIHQIAKQFSDSFTNINPCLLLPKKTFQVSFPEEVDVNRYDSADNMDPRNSCDVIYNNDVFEENSSLEMVKNGELKKAASAGGDSERKRMRHSKLFRKTVKRLVKEGNIGDGPNAKQALKIQGSRRRTRSGKIYNPFT